MASVLDWALIIIYMLSMVGVGMYFKTDDSMQDFAVADKKLGLRPRNHGIRSVLFLSYV